MNKLATGMLIGGAIGIAGAEYLIMNNTAKKKVMRKGKKIMTKAENMLEDASADMW